MGIRDTRLIGEIKTTKKKNLFGTTKLPNVQGRAKTTRRKKKKKQAKTKLPKT